MRESVADGGTQQSGDGGPTLHICCPGPSGYRYTAVYQKRFRSIYVVETFCRNVSDTKTLWKHFVEHNTKRFMEMFTKANIETILKHLFKNRNLTFSRYVVKVLL